MSDELTRYWMAPDGTMESCKDGEWVEFEAVEKEIERLRDEVKSLHLGREQDGQLLAEAQDEIDRLNTILLRQIGGRQVDSGE